MWHYLRIYKKISPLMLMIVFMLMGNRSEAQVYGCTDPLAINFNPAATINDGSCLYNPANTGPMQSFNLGGLLQETSGLIFWNNWLWTHNDNLDVNIYRIDTINGAIIQSYPLAGIENNDWEEISQDMDYIYLGDFGNNGGNRDDLKILKISKNSFTSGSPVIEFIEYSYSDQVDFSSGSNNTDYDCEAFVVSDDSIYLFTKQWVSKKTGVYSLSKNPGKQVAQLRASFDVNGLITGATLNEPERIIVLTGYNDRLDPFLFLLYDYRDHDFFSGNKRKIDILLPFHQVEGIAATNGTRYYISNENFSLFFKNVHQKLHVLDLSPYLGNYLNLPVPHPDTLRNFIISPIPAHSFITIKSFTDLLPADFNLINMAGQTVMTGRLSYENSTINIAGLASGLYILKIGEEKENCYKVVKE